MTYCKTPVGWQIAPVPMDRDRRPQLRDLDVEILMGYARMGLTLARCLATAALFLFLLPQSQAQTVDVSGRYQCAEARARGKGIPCKAAPLILKNDGHFGLRGWDGSYLVTGGAVGPCVRPRRRPAAPRHR